MATEVYGNCSPKIMAFHDGKGKRALSDLTGDENESVYPYYHKNETVY